jgi:hypothetical protein
MYNIGSEGVEVLVVLAACVFACRGGLIIVEAEGEPLPVVGVPTPGVFGCVAAVA